jgi:hypothetical protein
MTEETTAQPGTDTAATDVADTTTTAPVTATTTETKAADATLLGGGQTTTEPTVTAPATWPTDWRQQMAGEDKKLLERLGRLNSPLDVTKSWIAADKLISSGKLKKALPENPSEQELADWRKEQGIPEKAEDYKIELPDGVVLGAADKPLVDSFTKVAHENGWTEKIVNQAIAWNLAEQDRIAAEKVQRDGDFKRQSEDDLRREWGADFRRNLNAAENLIAGLPGESAKNFLEGRLADGTRIGDNAGVLKWLSSMSMDLNPAATLVPAGTSDAGKSVGDEIASIEKMMGDRSSDYWRGSKAEGMQQRYRELLSAREKMQSRAA